MRTTREGGGGGRRLASEGKEKVSDPSMGKELEVNRWCGKARGTRSSSLLP